MLVHFEGNRKGGEFIKKNTGTRAVYILTAAVRQTLPSS
jgi:hypothetical protein